MQFLTLGTASNKYITFCFIEILHILLLTHVQSEDQMREGRWAVQCDDEDGRDESYHTRTETYSLRKRLGRTGPGSVQSSVAPR